MAEKILIQSDNLQIEGLLDRRTTDKGAVISHPHPLYGGNMYAAGVESIVHAYWKKGYTTLRFNFRGVGNSQGLYDNGVGEQQDVLAALSFLSETGTKQIDLAGYSFGAWVNAHAVQQDTPVERMILVSPPVGFMDFTKIAAIDRLKLVVTGSRDQIAPAEQIKTLLPSWNPEARFEIIEGADHFYGGYLDRLEKILDDYL
ncbi:MAG: alpha/beta fold hydrolase [Desulfobacterales bacterium]|uniref:Alpha/beta fold hydrolase n=1 Tax=Candidatus Desulfatibia vada TaxID=2841696 RepID=A0A8J6P7P3_9BACT|nr:alpha/beta fold hydrolase [Candidatus Desulfatibia vada]